MTAALLQVAAAFGWGALLLRLVRADRALSAAERLCWAFPLGIGMVGWAMFPLSLLLGTGKAAALAAVLPGLAGLPLLSRPRSGDGFTRTTWLLLAAVLLLAAGDLAEGLSPPADADSMAYHFALPKSYLRDGAIVFQPRAVEAAIPLLQEMGFMAALATGGERALTLWCAFSGWALFAAMFGMARRHMSRDWALAVALVAQSLPAVLYAAGTGQVEVRMAAFAVVALAAAARARSAGSAPLAAVAGLAAGFCMASKYPGLFAAFAAGLAVLLPRWGGGWTARPVLAMGAAMLAAGGQWYLWNGLHTGDPVFPMLFGLVPYHAGIPWNTGMVKLMHQMAADDCPWPKTLLTLLAYPFAATFGGPPGFEAGRTGFGPLPVLLLPFALAGAWYERRRLAASPLTEVLAMSILMYVLWFTMGPSQRVRFFLPALAPALVVLTAAALRSGPALRRPLAAAFVVAIAGGLAGQAVFSLKFVRHLASDESREAFLARQIAAWPLADWLNHNLHPGDKVVLGQREIVYLIDPPSFYVNGYLENRISESRADPPTFWRQLRTHGVTHVATNRLDDGWPDRVSQTSGWQGLSAVLVAEGCARVAGEVTVPRLLQSRTLDLRAEGSERLAVVALTPATCRLETP